jgi:hypothetical protein
MRPARWILGALALVVVLAYIAGALIDEPIRRRMERDLNQALQGYTVRIREVDLHPLDLGVELVDAVVSQEENPEPPVAKIARLHAGLEWRALLRGRVVADLRIDRPALHLDLRQVQAEAQDDVPVEQRGWQEAVRHVHPFEINEVSVVDGTLTYIDEGPLEPLRLADVDLRVGNIQNVRAGEQYPSDVHLEARMLDTARLRVDGHADFLAEPHAGVKVRVEADDVDLGYLAPALRHADVDVRSGVLSARGALEYAPRAKILTLETVDLARADLDYVRRRTADAPLAEQATTAAARVTDEPTMQIDVARLAVTGGRFGYRDDTASPPYRLFLTGADLTVTNFTNLRTGSRAGPGHAELHGKFMGTGDASAEATFHPTARGTDFEAALRIERADLPVMNDLWRAVAGFDLERGSFSLYCELSVRQGWVEGYVKPFFHDLDVFDAGEESAGIGQKLYEALVGGAATVLENRSEDQVATETPISGRLDDLRTSTWRAVVGLVRNAFFQAVVPGLERSRARR